MKLKLIDKKRQAGDVISFIFDPQQKLIWIPGQFLIYSLPHKKEDVRGIQRFFTISSAPYEKLVMLSTKISKNSSTFKKSLNSIKIGDEISAKGPDGDFVIDNPKRNHIFIAGGIGITPFRSIILDLAHKNKPLNFTLIYSNKSAQFPFEEELNNAMKKFPHSQILKKIGMININDLSKLDKDSIFYVSGPDAMVDAMSKILLVDMAIDEENIVQDYFSGYD